MQRGASTCKTSMSLSEHRASLDHRRAQILHEENITDAVKEEWLTLVEARDHLLRQQLEQENEERFHGCLLELYSLLKAVGEFNHRTTPPPLKQALAMLYHKLHQYLKENDTKVKLVSDLDDMKSSINNTERVPCVLDQPAPEVKVGYEKFSDIEKTACDATERSLLIPNGLSKLSTPREGQVVVETLVFENDCGFSSSREESEIDSGLCSDKSSTLSTESPKESELSPDILDSDHDGSHCGGRNESSPSSPTNSTAMEGKSGTLPENRFTIQRPTSLNIPQNFFERIDKDGDEFCGGNATDQNQAYSLPPTSTPLPDLDIDDRLDLGEDSGINFGSLKPGEAMDHLDTLGQGNCVADELASPVELLECALARIRGARTLYH